MEIVLAVLALSFVMFVLLMVRATRAVARGVERTGQQVRRSLSETALRARSMQPGLVGDVARVRTQLRTSIDSTREVLRAGSTDDPALREALALLDQLHGHARQLDGELGILMSGEPDRARIVARLPELRERTADIRKSADALRFAAQDRVHQYDAEALDVLHQQIDIEADALRHWAPVEPGPEPSGPAVPPEPERRQLSKLRRRRPQDAG